MARTQPYHKTTKHLLQIAGEIKIMVMDLSGDLIKDDDAAVKQVMIKS